MRFRGSIPRLAKIKERKYNILPLLPFKIALVLKIYNNKCLCYNSI
uniref:Uncharacterized protein n=1 Tax=virus sp. ctRTq15 TaxID=2828253 RepID=A0A8S5RA34_9VIRU|nr:MAG TPA: hypothetical protein [virus sp. ctRTq15]